MVHRLIALLLNEHLHIRVNHKAIKSLGTSPNFLITLASLRQILVEERRQLAEVLLRLSRIGIANRIPKIRRHGIVDRDHFELGKARHQDRFARAGRGDFRQLAASFLLLEKRRFSRWQNGPVGNFDVARSSGTGPPGFLRGWHGENCRPRR